MGKIHQLDFVGNKGGGVNETKWAPYDHYKWNDNTYKWPYSLGNWEPLFITGFAGFLANQIFPQVFEETRRLISLSNGK